MQHVLLVEILVPAIAEPIVSGTLSVTIEAVPEADRRSIKLGGAQIQLNGFAAGRGIRLRTECPVETDLPLRNLQASAELKRRRSGALRAGDFTTAEASSFGTDGAAVVRLVPLDG